MVQGEGTVRRSIVSPHPIDRKTRSASSQRLSLGLPRPLLTWQRRITHRQTMLAPSESARRLRRGSTTPSSRAFLASTIQRVSIAHCSVLKLTERAMPIFHLVAAIWEVCDERQGSFLTWHAQQEAAVEPAVKLRWFIAARVPYFDALAHVTLRGHCRLVRRSSCSESDELPDGLRRG